jgi:SAM-dependent MidA family methyltransferase
MQAIANHTILPSDDILNKPGLCDLSAYVDFSALGAAA